MRSFFSGFIRQLPCKVPCKLINQQELLRIAVAKQGNFKFLEVWLYDVGYLRNLILMISLSDLS